MLPWVPGNAARKGLVGTARGCPQSASRVFARAFTCRRRRLRVILVPKLGGGLTNQLYELIATIAWAAATGAEV